MENYNLCWNEFENCAGATIKTLWSDNVFTDVTLVSDDQKQIAAHKVIIGSCSTFFRAILNSSQSKNLFIYLKGVNYNALDSILRFMYLGQTTVAHEKLDEFLTAAKELKVRGLHENLSSQSSTKQPQTNVYQTETPIPEKQARFVNVKTELDGRSGNELVLVKNDSDISADETYKQVALLQTDWQVVDNKHKCEECDYSTKNVHDLRRHKLMKHEGYRPQQCDKCDYRAYQTSDIRKHILRRHAGLKN